jgi:hypothetical protein
VPQEGISRSFPSTLCRRACHAESMSEHREPGSSRAPSQDAIVQSWPATVAALPLGSQVSGRVIARPAFGVFFMIDGVSNAVGLAEITNMPHHMELPPIGASVTGEVIWHADHNHQIRIRLHEWNSPSCSPPHPSDRSFNELACPRSAPRTDLRQQ